MIKKSINIQTYAILFLLSLLILLFRSAYTITIPHLYTEDGSWTGSILGKGFFYTLFYAKKGYFVFGNIILLKISLFLNSIFNGNDLANLPHFITLVHYLFYSFVAILPVICFKNIIRYEATLFIWLFTLLVPLGDTGYEIFGKLSNIGYLFYNISFYILVVFLFSFHQLSLLKIIVCDILIIVSCTTNPSCYVIVFITFFIHIIKRFNNTKKLYFKDSMKKIVFNEIKMKENINWICIIYILLNFLFLQKYLLNGSHEESLAIIVKSEIIEFFSRTLLFYFTYPFYNQMSDMYTIVLFIIMAILFFYIVNNNLENNTIKLFVFSFFATILISIMTLLARPSLTTAGRLMNYTSTFPDRYFYGTNLMSLIPMACIISLGCEKKNRTIQIIGRGISIYMFCLVFFNMSYLFEFDNSRIGQKEITFKKRIIESYTGNKVVDIDGERNYIVSIDFEGWTVSIPEKYIYATIRNSRDKPSIDMLDFKCVNLSDANWVLGISKNNPIILFENSLLNREILEKAVSLKANEIAAHIKDVQVRGRYIHVVCDDFVHLKQFQYPTLIEAIY